MRIATYGCSFTSYRYPTYADILACEHTVYNRGKSGVGNDWIFHTVMADYKKDFFKDIDLIVIQFTGFTRWNYLTETGWIGLDGSIFNPVNKESISTYKKIKSFYNTDYERQRFINYYYVLKNLFDKKCKILSYEHTGLDFVNVDDVANNYKGDYIFKPAAKNNKWLTKSWTDEHPTVLQHLELAHRVVPLTSHTNKKAKRCDNVIRKTQSFDTKVFL